MNDNISVKPDKTRLINLLDDISNGLLRIPVFQRDFVWNASQMIELFDSITKGYPIGSLLFWKPEAEFKIKEKIGPYVIGNTRYKSAYVLDGFQRITTLFGVLVNPKKFGMVEEFKGLKNYLIYYNLKEKEFTFQKGKKEKEVYLMPLYKVVDTFEFIDYLRRIENEIHDKIESNELIENAKQLSKILYDYEIPFVEIRGGDIKSAVQIFSRINSTGTEISEDFMLSALSYNQQTNFLFSDAITQFLNTLSVYNFDDLKRDTILNCIATAKGKPYFDVKIEELLHPDLEILTVKAFKHIRKAVDFLYKHVNVISSRLLPYPIQLVFISEYFRINDNPNAEDLVKLGKWFWKTSYSNYFTIYSLSQQRNAYKYFIDFARGNNKDGVYNVNPENKFSTADFPSKLNYSSVRSKVLQLFFLKNIFTESSYASEGIKEQLIFDTYEKTPANIILRRVSDFSGIKPEYEIVSFIDYDNSFKLKQYFISEKMIDYFKKGDFVNFIEMRENYIKEEENEFVSSLGITYTDLWF